MFLYAVRYQSLFLPKIRCKCLRFFVAKIKKPMEKPILLVAFDTLGRFFSVIIIFLKKLFLGKIENAIIFQHIPTKDIVCTRNCRFGKRRQIICLNGCHYRRLSKAKNILKCWMRIYQVIFILLAYVALP